MSVSNQNSEVKQYSFVIPPQKRIVLQLSDERTGKVISTCAMDSKYYDERRRDVVEKLYDRGLQEVLAILDEALI